MKDLDKIKREWETAQKDYEQNLERLRKANERMTEANNGLEVEKEQNGKIRLEMEQKVKEMEA